LALGWNTDLDNAGDRVLALQDQHGSAYGWDPLVGIVDVRRVGIEAVEIEANQNRYDDGVTFGTNTLTSASTPFSVGMVNEPILIEGFGPRVVASFVNSGEITFNGSPIAAGVGRKFVTPLGIAGGDRELEGTAGYPLAARVVDQTDVQSVINWLVGRKKQG
jgi:hypothetical protein